MPEPPQPPSLPAGIERDVIEALELEADRRQAELLRICSAHPRHAEAIRSYVALADEVAAAIRAVPRPPAAVPRPEGTGPYSVLEILGQGGMGTVWLAEQTEPVRRKVALKVVKLGMDSTQILARFAAEQRTLAAMNHDHIAKVFDAGLTARGQPWFAMEHVEGVPLDRHCDGRRLATRERLRLFLGVCEGVQHAHQKGVIHRDLKPSNVLVSVQGDRAVPKIIDFGLARAIERTGDESTSATLQGQLVGTPGYMSPEQAAGEVESVDTRTDVYCLGVVLYKLLVGALPAERGTTTPPADAADHRRLLRQDPLRPSLRLAQLGDEAAAIAARRGTAVRALARALRGDLDWIALKAIDPERDRRYQSVGELAEDLRRHLRCEPVLAVAPRAGYRLARLVRRHRVAVTAGALVFLAALAGLVGILWQAEIARGQASFAQRQARLAREQQHIAQERLRDAQAAVQALEAVNGFLTLDLLAAAQPEESLGRDVTVEEVLRHAAREVGGRFAGQPLVEAAVRHALGESFERLGIMQQAKDHHEIALSLRRRHLGPEHHHTLASGRAFAGVLVHLGEARAAEDLLREILAASIRSLGAEARDTLHARIRLARLLRSTNRTEEALQIYREVLVIQEREFGERHGDTLFTMELLGQVLRQTQRFAEAEAVMQKTLALRREVSGELNPRTHTVMNNLANLYHDLRDFAAAEPLYREALAITRELYGEDHFQLALILNNWATLLQDLSRADPAVDRLAEAEELLRQSIAIRKKAWGPEHHSVAIALNNLASLLQTRGDLAQAKSLFEESLGIQERHPDFTQRTRINTRYNLATLAAAMHDHGKAARLAAELRADAEAAYGAGHSMLALIGRFLADNLKKLGRFEEAEAPLLDAHRIAAAAVGKHARFTVEIVAQVRDFYRDWNRREGVDKRAEAALWEGRLLAARKATARR